jgi:hypothetical protein
MSWVQQKELGSIEWEGVGGGGGSCLMCRVESTRCVSMQGWPLNAQPHHVCTTFSRCNTWVEMESDWRNMGEKAAAIDVDPSRAERVRAIM